MRFDRRAKRLHTELLAIAAESVSLDHRALRTRIAQGLIETVGAAAAAITTQDPATFIVTSCATFGTPEDPEREIAFYQAEYGPEADINSVEEVARDPTRPKSMHRATHGMLERSVRWRTVLSRYGVADELRAALVARGESWGTINLYRLDRPFDDEDLELVGRAVIPLGELLRRALLRSLVCSSAATMRLPGVVAIGPGGRIEALSQEAEESLAAGGRDLEAATRGIIAAVSAGRAGHEPTLVICPSGERFAVHPTIIAGRPAAIVESPRPAALADHLIRAWGLTPRERAVVRHVLAGDSTKTIATTLAISSWTVQDHLKAIFAKAGVSSRRDLVAMLAFERYLPKIQQGATTSPYGWFVEPVHIPR